MAMNFEQIKRVLSRLYIEFTQCFAENSDYYTIMSQQDYQMFRMRDI